MFEECRVTDVKSVSEFLDRYYKHDRYRGRGADYAAALLKSYESDIAQDGYAFISQWDSVTGRVVSFWPESVR